MIFYGMDHQYKKEITLNKTKVVLNHNCSDGDYVKGEIGFIDGYIFHERLGRAMACVVIDERIVVAPLCHLTKIDFK